MKAGRVIGAALMCAVLGAAASLQGARAAEEAKPAMTDCEMKFDLKGWSAFYKTAKGEGTITCSNGQSARVSIRAKGGGITFGKSEVIGGTGKFSEARNIDELLGSY